MKKLCMILAAAASALGLVAACGPEGAPAAAEARPTPAAKKAAPAADAPPYLAGSWTRGEAGCSHTRPGDPEGPRICSVSYPQADVPTADKALARAAAHWKLDTTGLTPVREIAAWRQTFGAPAFIVAGEGRLAETRSRIIVYMVLSPQNQLEVNLIEAPAATYAAWGGIASALTALGLASSMAEFDPAFVEGARRLTPAQDQEVADAFVSAKVGAMTTALVMTHMSTLGMMQQMNQNLSTETACVLTPGCDAQMGAGGETVMTPIP